MLTWTVLRDLGSPRKPSEGLGRSSKPSEGQEGPTAALRKGPWEVLGDIRSRGGPLAVLGGHWRPWEGLGNPWNALVALGSAHTLLEPRKIFEARGRSWTVLGRCWYLLEGLGRSWTVLEGLGKVLEGRGRSSNSLESCGWSWTVFQPWEGWMGPTQVLRNGSRLAELVGQRCALHTTERDGVPRGRFEWRVILQWAGCHLGKCAVRARRDPGAAVVQTPHPHAMHSDEPFRRLRAYRR